MKLPRSYYNPISLIGSLLAGVSLALIISLSVAISIFGSGSSYIGLFIYIVIPVFLIIGLILIPIGMLRTTRRLRKKGALPEGRGLRIDFNNRNNRNALYIFVTGSVIFLFLTGIGSYEAFHYTESNEFCGLLCHKVMEPEYVAYQGSSHARVKCVECHVGEGANWYVKSKLSGLYQVYAVLTKIYPTPIPTPVVNLRPARETCEKCHWPNKFYSYRLRNEVHYLADEANTEWNIQLKMKIGSENSAHGLSEGIHWHINPDTKVEYVPTGPDRQTIPWVRFINTATGDTTVYEDYNMQLDAAALDTMELRVMDCIDCHNRPSHHYLPPQEFIDLSITAGSISSELPEIKRLAMMVLNTPYSDSDTARMLIDSEIRDYYAGSYPELTGTHGPKLDAAIEAIQTGFGKNFFPAMKASWDVYPNDIGHIEFNGCFRCHNGNHVSSSGQEIRRDCNLCHTIILQGTPGDQEKTSIDNALDFRHPVDIGEAWKEMTCTECHRYLY